METTQIHILEVRKGMESVTNFKKEIANNLTVIGYSAHAHSAAKTAPD